MSKKEILECVINNHNRLAQITVNGDNAIMMGDTLKELRMLAQAINRDVEAELAEKDTEGSNGEVN